MRTINGFSQSGRRSEEVVGKLKSVSNCDEGKVKRNRRGLNRNKRNNFNMIGNMIRVIAINAAGITSKMQSFDKVLCDRKPSIWMLQETKRKPSDPKMKGKT